MDEYLNSDDEYISMDLDYVEVRKHFKKLSRQIDDFISLISNLELNNIFKLTVVKHFSYNPVKGIFTRKKKLQISIEDIENVPFNSTNLEIFYNFLDPKKNIGYSMDFEVIKKYREYFQGEKVQGMKMFSIEI